MNYSILKKLFFLFTFILFMNISFSYAANSKPFFCKERVAMLSNLNDKGFKERFLIWDSVSELLKRDAKDAYQLSLPLLVSAQLGNKELYDRALAKMIVAMKKISAPSQNSFKAWLYGRMVFAAHSMHDSFHEQQYLKELMLLLDDPQTARDRFTTWAMAYVAAANQTDYQQLKEKLKVSADVLTQNYFAMNKNENKDKLQEARSDALWAWVMNAQAAANANDKESFSDALQQMKKITSQDSISAALTTGLLRTSASNDYPAWAMAIVRLAAVKMDDEKLFVELEKPLNIATQGAAQAEKILAQVNDQLAIENHDLIVCSSSKRDLLLKK